MPADVNTRTFFYENFVVPSMNQLFGLCLALKKHRCVKAFRFLRTALANSGALTSDTSCSWFYNREEARNNIYALRCALIELTRLVAGHRDPAIRATINQVANCLASSFYCISWRWHGNNFDSINYDYINEVDRIMLPFSR